MLTRIGAAVLTCLTSSPDRAIAVSSSKPHKTHETPATTSQSKVRPKTPLSQREPCSLHLIVFFCQAAKTAPAPLKSRNVPNAKVKRERSTSTVSSEGGPGRHDEPPGDGRRHSTREVKPVVPIKYTKGGRFVWDESFDAGKRKA